MNIKLLLAVTALPFIAGVLAFNIIDGQHDSRATAPATPEAGCLDQNILKVVRSLRQEPTKWQADTYRLERGTGFFDFDSYLGIWIANSDYGLDFIIKSDRRMGTGIDYPMTDECRRFLYQEIQKWRYNAVSKAV